MSYNLLIWKSRLILRSYSQEIMVTGSSGSGKSSLIHHIALKVYREQGYELTSTYLCLNFTTTT